MRARLVVLASGNGSNLQAIIDACATGRLDADVVAVVSDHHDAYALARARLAGIPSVHIGRHDGEARADYDARLADLVSGFSPTWVVLAGWMRLLSMSFLGWFPQMVVNLHPALPGEFPGTHAIERAYAEWQQGRRTGTGVMVHLVPDEGVDDGPALATAVIDFRDGETLEEFTARVHSLEHTLLVDTLTSMCPSGALQ